MDEIHPAAKLWFDLKAIFKEHQLPVMETSLNHSISATK
jgi:hypothetical protein